MSNSQASPVQNITLAGWGLLGSAGLLLVVSFLPWWTIETPGESRSESGWFAFWWIGVVLAVVAAVAYALIVFEVVEFKVDVPLPLVVAYASLATFAVTLLALVHTLLKNTFDGVDLSEIPKEAPIAWGPSFGIYIALIAAAVLAYCGSLAAQEAGAKLPFTVPGRSVR